MIEKIVNPDNAVKAGIAFLSFVAADGTQAADLDSTQVAKLNDLTQLVLADSSFKTGESEFVRTTDTTAHIFDTLVYVAKQDSADSKYDMDVFDGNTDSTKIAENKSAVETQKNALYVSLAELVMQYPDKTAEELKTVVDNRRQKQQDEIAVEKRAYAADANAPKMGQNPFNPATSYKFGLNKEADVKVDVYDISGKLIKNVADGKMSKGQHVLPISLEGQASGLYVIKATIDGKTYKNRASLVR